MTFTLADSHAGPYIRTGHAGPSQATTVSCLHSNGETTHEHHSVLDTDFPRPTEAHRHRHAHGAGTLSGCQAGAYFDNEVIPPGAPRPKLPWAYSYAQFDALLSAYPDVHPEDFVTYGILQAQPCRGSYTKWGDVASVLSHMVGGYHP